MAQAFRPADAGRKALRHFTLDCRTRHPPLTSKSDWREAFSRASLEVSVSDLARFGWNPFFDAQRQQLGRGDLLFARVIEEQRGVFRGAGEVQGPAEPSGRFRYDAIEPGSTPAVGDWVGVRAPQGDGRAVIHVRLERRTTVSRA